MSVDAIQKMCFVVCYNSIRTRGVLAIPTPVRYADLCCYRSKLHVEAQRDLMDEQAQANPEALEADLIASLNEAVKVNDKVRNRLYYC